MKTSLLELTTARRYDTSWIPLRALILARAAGRTLPVSHQGSSTGEWQSSAEALPMSTAHVMLRFDRQFSFSIESFVIWKPFLLPTCSPGEHDVPRFMPMLSTKDRQCTIQLDILKLVTRTSQHCSFTTQSNVPSIGLSILRLRIIGASSFLH